MKINEVLLEYKTKDNRPITFKIIEDEEGDNNRGWQVDTIKAFVDGQQAGYIKITYIPKERFNEHYPTILNYLSKIKGWSGLLPLDKNNEHWKDLTTDEKRSLVLTYHLHTRFPALSQKEINNIPDNEIDSIVKDVEKHATKKYGKEFKQDFINYYVDKPYEDYIRVFSKDDTINPRSKEPTKAVANYKRLGIALALYAKAVDFLNKKGLKLRLSTLRSPGEQGGQSIGDRLIQAGVTVNDGQFDYIVPEKMKQLF